MYKFNISLSYTILIIIGLCSFQTHFVFGSNDNENVNVDIRSVIITGNNSFTQKQLLQMIITKEGDTFNKDTLKQDTEKIAAFYRGKGFTYARVLESPNIINGEVFIRLRIDEGEIGKITLSGNAKTNDNVILRELLFKSGDVFIEADRKESERILRQKPYIGAAKIESKWIEESNSVAIHVSVTEYFSITVGLDPGINNQSGYFLTQIKETNVFGSGQGGQVRYERISEVGEKTRGVFTLKYRMPRLVDSYWNFDGEYIQKREGDSWGVLIARPQYSLKSRWSANFKISESINHVSWYEDGRATDTFERSSQRASGVIQRYFGGRHHQNYIGLWYDSFQTIFFPVETLFESRASQSNQNISRIGITVGRKNVGYHQTRFLRRMGSDEDFVTGSQYNLSIGQSSPLYGSEKSESIASLAFNSGWTNKDRLFGTALIAYTTSFSNHIESTVIHSRSSFYYRDVFNTGDIYRVDKGFRVKRLFDFQQTFVAQFKSEMQFGLGGESQVILGADNGLRGYSLRQFNGEKVMVFSLESRTLCGGTFFKGINDGLTRIATFIAKPIFKNRIIDLGLVLSATSFVDIGYIWDTYNTFDITQVKRAVGFGIRGNFSKVSNAGIFRFEIAFPLDHPTSKSIQSQLFYGVERAF